MALKLSSVQNRKKDLVCSIVFRSGVSDVMPLRVTLRYRAAQDVQGEVDKGKARIMQRQSHVTLEDIERQNQELEELLRRILADNVLKVQSIDEGPVTLDHLRGYMALSPDEVSKLGGLGTAVPFDTTSGTDDEKQAAKENILDLLAASVEFRRNVEAASTSVRYFQDKDFEDQVKNSVAGTPSA
jgi:hypothetical protein